MSLPKDIKKRNGHNGWWTSWWDTRRHETIWRKLADTMPLARREYILFLT
jgi:hypothetical protein